MNKIFIDFEIKGLERALQNDNIVVIVDVLSFSSAVTTATANGFEIYPVSDVEFGKELASKIGAEISGKRGVAKFSLSPLTFLNKSENNKVVLFSPNGAACSELIKDSNIGFIGCFLNAKAVATKVQEIAKKTNKDIALIAANEQRAIKTGERVEYIKDTNEKVFALEDYLGCGAICSELDFPKTPEALVCESSFIQWKEKIYPLLSECFSGQYLIQKGSGKDVEFVSKLNVYDVVPVINSGKIVPIKS